MSRRILLMFLLETVVVCVCWYAFFSNGRYQGRTEYAWITSLSSTPGKNEIESWRSLGPDAVPILIRALRQGNGPVTKSYSKFWRTVPPVVRKRLPWPRDWFYIRRGAPLMLLELTNDISSAAPALGRALHDDDQTVRVNVAVCLMDLVPKLGAGRSRLVPDLLYAMNDTNRVVREFMTQCLAHCPEESRLIVPALARACDDPDLSVRYFAVQALKHMNLDGAAGVLAPVLLRSLNSGDVRVCADAAAMLSRMKYDPAREIPVFTGMLNDHLLPKRCTAALALGKYGPQAAPAIPALRQALERGEPPLRNAASNALVQIDPQKMVKP